MGQKLVGISAILNLVLAIAAAVLSFMLLQKRAELRDYAEKTAVSFGKVVKTLDKESGTNVSGKVKISPRNKESKTPDKGPLSWQGYQDAKDEAKTYKAYTETLKKAETQAAKVIEQRNVFADQLYKTAINLKLSNEQLGIEDIADIKDIDAETEDGAKRYTELTAKISNFATAINKRDDAILTGLTAMAEIINTDFDSKSFHAVSFTGTEASFDVAQALTDMKNAVKNSRRRSDDMAATIGLMLGTIDEHEDFQNIDTDALQGDYGQVLAGLEDHFSEINDKLAEQKELSKEKVEIGGIMEEKDAQIQAKNSKIVEYERIVQHLEQKVSDLEYLTDTSKKIAVNQDLQGKILEIDEDFHFVIIDIGRSQKIQNGVKMAVVREGKVIGRVEISDVDETYCVAEIISQHRNNKIQKADKVFVSVEHFVGAN